MAGSERRFRDLVENIDEVVYEVDDSGVVTYINPAIQRLLGFDVAEAVGHTIGKFIFEEDLPRATQGFQTVLAGQQVTNDYRLLTKTGEVRWARTSSYPVLENGRVTMVRGVLNDITELKGAEERMRILSSDLEKQVEQRTAQLRKSEANLRNLINSTDDLFCIRDMDGGVVTWNTAWGDTFRAMFGADPHAGMNTTELMKSRIPDFTEHHLLMMKRAYAGEVAQEELSLETPDGESEFYEFTYTPVVEGGRIIGLGEYTRNITERKLEQQRLQEAQEKYRTVADFTYDWEYWEAPDGQLLYVSPSCERISGYGAQEFIEDPGLLTKLVLDADRPQWDRHVAAEGTEGASIQFRMTTKAGQIRWVEHICTQVVGEDGAPLGIRGSNRDITDRKVVEDALRREQESRAAAWREASTQRGLLAHAQRISSVEGLASSLAHDLSQPLAAILSNAQAARRFLHASEPDTDEVKTILDDIIAADKRAGELIWRLRSFVRREPTEHVPLDVNAVIKSVVEILNSDMVIKGVALRTELSEKLPMVMGDQIQLQQILVNLITNAEHAVTDLPDSRRKIVVRSNEAITNAVVVEIRDRGPGFDTTGGDIFEPFFTTKSDGMGMGLSICRSLVESQGGQIWAENAADGGARVCFALPVAAGAPDSRES